MDESINRFYTMPIDHNHQIPCAIIGLGRIASLLEDDPLREKPCTHAGAINHHPLTYVCGGFDVQSSRRRNFEKRWQVPTYSTLEKLINEKKPAIVHIATHPQTHLVYLKACLEYGISVIVCEKPLTYDLKSAQEILDQVNSVSAKVIINHERRFALDYNHVKKVITDKKYGELLSIHAKLYLGERRFLLDMLWDDGTHLIDVMHFLTDTTFEVNSVIGCGQSRGDNLWIQGKLSSVDVVVECGGGRDHVVFELDLSFKSGRILIGNGLYKEFRSDISPYYDKMKSLRKVPFVRFPVTKYFSGMMEQAVRAYVDPTFMPQSNIKDALMVTEVIVNILDLS